MKYLVTGKEMQLLDKNTSEHFMVPTVVLMEQAADAFVRELLSIYDGERDPEKDNPEKNKQFPLQVGRRSDRLSVLLVCGLGNNGADGIAAARLLNQRGIRAEVYLMQEQFFPEKKGSDLYELQKMIYEKYNFPKTSRLTDSYDIIVDAVFGIGLTREVGGHFAEVIDQLNQMQGIKIALDISSGVDADRGHQMGTAFRADDTITFSFGKMGQYLWPGCEFSGRVHVVPMGITKDSALEQAPGFLTLEFTDLKDLLPRRSPHSNKGTYGKLLIIGGKKNMAGAACLSAKAAYRTGAGLVQVLTGEENRTILQELVPEAILTTYTGTCPAELLQEKMDWADVIVLGPGMGTGKEAETIVSYVLTHAAGTLILDADGLNLAAKNPGLLDQCRADLVITPHLGEMSRLTGLPVPGLQEDLAKAAGDFAARHHLYCVLKDFRTVIACPDGRAFLNLTGNNGMAAGGSGDVLTGVIGGLAAQGSRGENLWKAAAAGPYLHGLAGDAAAENTGTYGLMARDLIDGLCRVWLAVSGKVGREP